MVHSLPLANYCNLLSITFSYIFQLIPSYYCIVAKGLFLTFIQPLQDSLLALIELTMPREDRLEETFERKVAKYQRSAGDKVGEHTDIQQE